MVERSRNIPLADPRRSLPCDPLEGLDRGEDRLNLEVLTWNLFHGRDHPPGGARGDISWRLFGKPSKRGEYLLLNRDLRAEFVRMLDRWTWDVALLQEVPVGWVGELARGTGATGRATLTSRNWMSPVMAPVWTRRPHLIGSWEGGSNLVLVRGGWRIRPGSSRSFTLRLRPERRRLQMVELERGPLVFDLHASTGRQRAAEDVRWAAATATREASGRPFLFGGDLNVSPADAPSLFEGLARDHCLLMPEGADRASIDQILASGSRSGTGERVPSDRRDVTDSETGLKVRLSDHDPVVARFEF